MILSMLYKNPPDKLKLILVDPKEVEFSPYEDIPHLLTPVITDMPRRLIVWPGPSAKWIDATNC